MTISKSATLEDLYPIIEQKMKEDSSFSFRACGVSMLPYIRDGKDLVTLGKIKEPLKKNDVVFYRRSSGQFVLHRIVKIRDDQKFDLCGDHQFRIERGVLPEQMIAKLVRLERDGKQVFLTSRLTTLWCFLLPVRRFFLRILFPVKSLLKPLFKK